MENSVLFLEITYFFCAIKNDDKQSWNATPFFFFFLFSPPSPADMQRQHCKNIITLLSAWRSGGEKNGAARWAEICHDVRRSGQMIAVITESHSHETGRSIKVKGEPFKNAVVLTSVTNICPALTTLRLSRQHDTSWFSIAVFFFYFRASNLCFPLTWLQSFNMLPLRPFQALKINCDEQCLWTVSSNIPRQMECAVHWFLHFRLRYGCYQCSVLFLFIS